MSLFSSFLYPCRQITRLNEVATSTTTTVLGQKLYSNARTHCLSFSSHYRIPSFTGQTHPCNHCLLILRRKVRQVDTATPARPRTSQSIRLLPFFAKKKNRKMQTRRHQHRQTHRTHPEARGLLPSKFLKPQNRTTRTGRERAKEEEQRTKLTHHWLAPSCAHPRTSHVNEQRQQQKKGKRKKKKERKKQTREGLLH